MKKINLILSAFMLTATACFVGCSDDNSDFGRDGRLYLNTSVNSDIKVVSRAADNLNDDVIIFISNEKGLVRKYQGINNLPADGITLAGGNYIAEAWAGDSVSASWDARYYKGRQPFAISGSDVTVNLRCTVANVLASVKYGKEVDNVLRDYTMTVSHSRGELAFEGRDERVGSFMMPSTSKDLTWKLEGTDFSGKKYVKEGVIENVKPAHQYILNVNYTGGSTSVGGGYLSIVVDDTEVVIEDVVTIIAAPKIEGYDFDITEPTVAEPGEVGRKSLFISAAAQLSSVILEYDQLDQFLGLGDVDGHDIDLMRMSDEVKNKIEAKGMTVTYAWNAETETSSMKITFEEQLMNSLPDGEHTFTIKASIIDGERVKTSVANWLINLSGDPVATQQVNPEDVWATHTTLTGRINKPEATDIQIRYRQAGSQQWSSIPANVNGSEFSAQIEGLAPATRYEYQAVCQGFEPASSLSFTTEEAALIPNGSFEQWSGSAPMYIAADKDNIFWDSGNHGSATMGKDITTPSTDYVHDGTYSAKLESQFVGLGGLVGKFAAGNLFIGKYLRTDGTNGVLGWGRPFNSRPKALKGFVKYTPAVVDSKDEHPEMKKGDMDKGIIYVAILDNSLTNVNDSKVDEKFANWPVIVKTKGPQLFNPEASNVIAYGELILDATSGDGLVEFTIPLDYRATDVKASNLMIVCSASKYGDYFVGGNSVMYIDDFKFEY